MAIVQYIPAPPKPPKPPEPPRQRLPPQRAPLTESEERYRQARAMGEEMKIAKAKQELIPRDLALKQASFLVLSIRARLLALPAEMGLDRELEEKLTHKLRSALEELVDFPERVTDPDWMLKLR